MRVATSYNANAALYGRARSDGAGGYSVRWTLVSQDGASEASGSLDEGVHLAADTFARVYAASGSSLDSVLVEVSGIQNLDAYAGTLNYLEAMTLVGPVADRNTTTAGDRPSTAICCPPLPLARYPAASGSLMIHQSRP